uniref:Uncharacterized protein n=1 Tax=Oryzias sinensis TaxID=183150 RepID=A0A8C7ZN96_9TELE
NMWNGRILNSEQANNKKQSSGTQTFPNHVWKLPLFIHVSSFSCLSVWMCVFGAGAYYWRKKKKKELGHTPINTTRSTGKEQRHRGGKSLN